MEKDFTEWHFVKTNLQSGENDPFFYEREVWLCAIGFNVGHEEDGKGELYLRPVIILKKFGPELFWGIPLMSKKRIEPYCYHSHFAGKTGSALLIQLRLLDRKRLLRKMGVVSKGQFFEIRARCAQLFF